MTATLTFAFVVLVILLLIFFFLFAQNIAKLLKSYMLAFNFIVGLSFIFFCFNLIIIHYHTQKQKKIIFKQTI